MLRFQLASDDRLHFASKAICQTDRGGCCGILILTDRRLYFGGVGSDFYIEMDLADITEIAAEDLAEQWPPTNEKERLTVTEKDGYEFIMSDAHACKRQMLTRPSAFHLLGL